MNGLWIVPQRRRDPARFRRDLSSFHMKEWTRSNLGMILHEMQRPWEALGSLSESLPKSHPSDFIVRKLYALISQCREWCSIVFCSRTTATSRRLQNFMSRRGPPDVPFHSTRFHQRIPRRPSAPIMSPAREGQPMLSSCFVASCELGT